MYNEESSTKLAKQICDIMNKHRFTDKNNKPMNIKYGTGLSFTFLPEENLQRIKEIISSTYAAYDPLMELLGQEKLFQFDPYIYHKDDLPILVIRRDRFIYFDNKHCRFFVTETPNGIGLITNSSRPVEFLVLSDPYLKESKVGYFLWWASLLDAAGTIPAFRKAMDKHTQVIEEFLHETLMKFCWRPKYSYKDILNSFTVQEGNLKFEYSPLYQLRDSSGIKCRLYFSNLYIQAEIPGNKVIEFSIPTSGEGIHKDRDGAAHFAQLRDYKQILEKNSYELILMHLLLNYLRLHLNYIKLTAVGMVDTMYPANRKDIYNIETLQDLEKLM